MERRDLPFASLPSKCPEQPQMGQAEAGSEGLKLGLPCDWWALSQQSHPAVAWCHQWKARTHTLARPLGSQLPPDTAGRPFAEPSMENVKPKCYQNHWDTKENARKRSSEREAGPESHSLGCFQQPQDT